MTTTTEVPQITIPNLATEFDMDPRTIRRLIRGLDFRAPRGEDTANRYAWTPDSQDLEKIRQVLHAYKNPPPKPEAKVTPIDAPVDERPKTKRAPRAKAAKPKEEVAAPDPESMDLGEEAAEAGSLV